MKCPVEFVALSLVSVLFGSAPVTAQEPDQRTRAPQRITRPPNAQKEVQKVAQRPLAAPNEALLAKGSPALRQHLLQTAGWLDKLMADPRFQSALEREPELLRRLKEDAANASNDAAVVARVLEYEAVVRLVLDDQEAQDAVNKELSAFHDRVRLAEIAQRRGDARAAAELFDAAAQEAARLGNRPAEAEARLDGARALEALDRQSGKAENSAKALAWYDEAIGAGEASQRSLARNNKGVALLGLGRGTEALAELQHIDYAAVAESDRPMFQYNLARAYEGQGSGDRAIAVYRGVVQLQPSFRPAVDRLYGLLRASSDPQRIQTAAALTGDLVRQGQAPSALENAKRCLEQWRAEPAVPAICEVLVLSYVESRVGPADFQKTEQEFLERVVKGARDAPTEKYLTDFTALLRRAYLEELPVETNPRLARELFPAPNQDWSAERITGVNRSREVSRLLKVVGDHYDNGGNPRQALARYLLSWNLDPGNTEALVFVADMVRRDGEHALDDELRRSLVSRIFEEKNSEYRVQYKSAQDWLNLLRYHVLLANIFEKRGEWGSSHEAASVIFQLERAIAAEEHVRTLGVALEPSPGLHYRLGQAYVAVDRPSDRDKAWQGFVRAAQGFVTAKNAPEARIAFMAANALQSPGDVGAVDRRATTLFELDERIRALEDGR